jgi:hypothetical protein
MSPKPEVWTRTELGESSLDDFEVGNLVTFHLRQFPHDWLGKSPINGYKWTVLVLMGTASVNVGLSIALFDYQRVIPPKACYIFLYQFWDIWQTIERSHTQILGLWLVWCGISEDGHCDTVSWQPDEWWWWFQYRISFFSSRIDEGIKILGCSLNQ